MLLMITILLRQFPFCIDRKEGNQRACYLPAMTTYNNIRKQRDKAFETSFSNYINSATGCSDNSQNVYEGADKIYYKSIHKSKYSQFGALPEYLQRKIYESGNKRSILDKMRTQQQSDVDTIGQSSNEMVPFSSTSESQAQSLSVYNPRQVLGENAFANKLLVPQISGKSTQDTTEINRHSDWKLSKLILGHTGQVYSLAIDPLNKFYASGSSDRTIKIWNLASNQLQLTLTGHIMAVRGLCISDRHPYMFSCSEDKTVKCWDLEKNKAVRDYHGHLSSVYTIDIHPTLDLIVTGGRDSSVRVWDIRTRTAVYTLTGHKGFVNKVACRSSNPQILSSSMDSTLKSWDLVAGKCDKTLTYHSKSIRSFAVSSQDDEIITGSSDGIKKFNLPELQYMQDLQFFRDNDELNLGNTIINTISSNPDGVVVIGCDNGKIGMSDWSSGSMFQELENIPVPGSLPGENGVICSTFDRSGLRLITGNVDKSIKIYKQVDEF